MSAAGIPTSHRGITFRSRLEARWAAFFDLIGWHWTYEPFDANGYIPDFLVHGDRPFIVEVKPAANPKELEQHIDKVAKAEREALLVGVSPIMDGGYPYTYPAGGVLLQDFGDYDADGQCLAPGAALWHSCSKCQQIAVHHDTGCWYGYPCDHYEGDHYLDPISNHPEETLLDAWAVATNRTQWRQ